MSNMRKNIFICVALWTVLLAAAMVAYFFPSAKPTEGITKHQRYTMSDDAVYVGENDYDHAVIYKLGWTGDLKKVFYARMMKGLKMDQIEEMTYNKSLFVLLSRHSIYEGRDVATYRIVRLDNDLRIEEASDFMVLGGDLRITGLTADDKMIYITATNLEGTEAYVYQVEIPHLKEFDEDDEGKDRLTKKPMRTELADNGRRFADCEYTPGIFHYRYDNQEPDEYFLVPATVQKAYGSLTTSSGQRHMMEGIHYIYIIFIWVIGIPVIVMLLYLFHDKNRAVYAALMLEFVFFVLIAFGVYGMMHTHKLVTEEEYGDYTDFVMEEVFSEIDLYSVADGLGLNTQELSDEERDDLLLDFYDSEYYQNMTSDLKNKVALTKKGRGIAEIVLVNRKSGEILVSSNGNNRVGISALYGKNIAKFAVIATAGGNVRSTDITTGGEPKVVMARSLDSAGLQGFTLVGIGEYKTSIWQVAAEHKGYFKKAFLLFLAVSLALIIIFMLEGRELHAITRMLKNLAEGRGEIKNLTVHGRDLNAMKNSVFEIQKNINTVNRSKYMIFEAYYRFAPKSIEKILDRDSITEVGIGDSTQIEGTMAICAMKEKRTANSDTLQQMNHEYEIIETCREDHGGIYITNNETLSKARILFPASCVQSVQFGVDVCHNLREWKHREYMDCLVLLHYTGFSYGVCGTENQSMSILSSRETELMASFSDWLRSMRLAMVVSGAVLEREQGYGETRYLGFIQGNANTRIDLYEILGAQSTRVATARRRTKDAFEAAIQMFYDKDFYLARNAFTEILREFPEDEIVKWYLFECETQLNGNYEGTFTGALHM